MMTGFLSCKKKNPEPSLPTTYYYPPLTGRAWETISAKVLGWDVNKLNEAVDFIGANNSTGLLFCTKAKLC